ncbi:glycosyltransferase family 2 protein [Sphingobacterium kyonggiense]
MGNLNNHKPSVSIIIPIYNSSKFLEKCVNGLMLQTFNDIEFIFVDDFSNDDSLEILHNLLKKYPNRIHQVRIILHDKNYGSAIARNTGLKNSTGRFIGWVDADDYIELDMFESLYNIMIQTNSDLVWCDFDLIYSQKTIYKPQNFSLDVKEYMNGLIDNTIQGNLWNKLFKAEIIHKNNLEFLQGQNMGEDRMFLFKYLFYCYKLYHLPKIKYHYVQINSYSLTRIKGNRRAYEEINNNTSILDFISINNLDWINIDSINDFKLKSKDRLLHSTTIDDFKKWKLIFPEVNWNIIYSNTPFQHKILGLMSHLSIWPLINIWIKLKTNFNKNVY